MATSKAPEKRVCLCSRMFRSAPFITSACLLWTHRPLFGTLNNSKKKNLGKTVCNSLLLQPFCMVSRERGPQRKHDHISKPRKSKYVSQTTHFSCLVNTSCSISESGTPDFLSVCKINISAPYHLNTIFSDNFILRDSDECLLPENYTGKHRSSVDKWRAGDLHSRKSQKSYQNSGSILFTKLYELRKVLWTSYQERWSHVGTLKSQMCGIHRRVPQQAAFKDCLSAKNKERCRGGLQSNAALYEKERVKSRAAVLVSLCTVGGEPALLFTLRSSKLRGRHKGDVSFAGGKQDPSDRNIVETALREAREELGIKVTENEVWGVLKPLNDASGMMIAPVLANLGPLETLTLCPNLSEVEEIFTLTVAHLCNPQNRGYTHFRTGDRYGYTLPVFHSDKYRIWGLTAVALDHTLKLIVPE